MRSLVEKYHPQLCFYKTDTSEGITAVIVNVTSLYFTLEYMNIIVLSAVISPNKPCSSSVQSETFLTCGLEFVCLF